MQATSRYMGVHICRQDHLVQIHAKSLTPAHPEKHHPTPGSSITQKEGDPFPTEVLKLGRFNTSDWHMTVAHPVVCAPDVQPCNIGDGTVVAHLATKSTVPHRTERLTLGRSSTERGTLS